jgi:hypothetical protein
MFAGMLEGIQNLAGQAPQQAVPGQPQPGFDARLTNAMQSPLFAIGTNLLANNGGNMNNGQRLGNAALGAAQQISEQQRMQQLNEYRKQQMDSAQAAQRMQQAQQEAAQRSQEAWQRTAQSESFQRDLGPLGRQYLAAGGSMEQVLAASKADQLQVHRNAQLLQDQQQFQARQAAATSRPAAASSPKGPTPRGFVDQPLGGDTYQRMQFDAATGQYKPFGEPFNKHSTRAGKAAADDPVSALVGNIMGGQQPAGPAPAAVQAAPQAAAGGMPKVTGDADYQRLPSGTRFMAPDGTVRTKP